MLSVPDFYNTGRRSIFRLSFSIPKQFHFLQPRKPSQYPRFCYLDALTTTKKMPPSSAVKIVAEYAKSNRSACRICSDKISVKALRLGLVTIDPRGYDTYRWHHLNCFPIDSEQIVSAENINGFSSLKSGDQETLKKLFEENHKSMEEVEVEVEVQVTDKDGDEDETEEHEKSSKKRRLEGTKEEVTDKDRDEDKDKDEAGKHENSLKKRRLTTHVETELDIALSVADIKDKYRDAKLGPKWKAFQTIIFLERDDSLHDSEKIAAFDFDGCLVNTSVKRYGADAWSLMYKSIPDKLQSLYNNGYKLVIFTNESNIDRWKNKRQAAVDSKIGRLDNFIKLVNVPMQVFIACGVGNAAGKPEDPFRKPKPGMWHVMEEHFNSGISIDMDQSFYVGDAAGRKNDHSDADIKFAQNIGLKFYVPEEYFDS